MKKLLILLLILLVGGLIFKQPLKNFYNSLPRKFSGLEKTLNQTLSELPKISTTRPIISAPPPLRAPKKTAPYSALTRAGIIAETNRERALYHLPALTENQQLGAVAEAKTADLFAKQYFEHISPSGAGPSDLAETYGYAYSMIGENLALGNFANDRELVTAWMNSPGHRANILNTRYTEIGVAAAAGLYEGERTWMAVQEFGLPKAACAGPTTELKAALDADQAELTRQLKALEEEKAALESAPQNNPAYNDKVEEFNALVEQYNVLLNSYKATAQKYNTQAAAFNVCVQGG